MQDKIEKNIKNAHFIAIAKYMFRSGMIDSETLNKILKKIDSKSYNYN